MTNAIAERLSLPRSTADEALGISGITFDYGKRRALADLSFSIRSGETVILLGPNGAGKSTLFSLISGLFAPQTGLIDICGRNFDKHGAAALSPLGIVFQQQTLDLDLTVRQNLRYFCALRGIDRKTADQRIETGLTRLAMAERLDEKVRALNGGHRRRVELARATLHHPKLLLL
ncbi:ABC transporter ATP-binding protein, partial [Salmonella enterica subsp. enterica serovar Virchow]|nr:ABC transporter ATP-binding protein [Salmonella enterica subsp. enterica serovar Virchow]